MGAPGDVWARVGKPYGLTRLPGTVLCRDGLHYVL